MRAYSSLAAVVYKKSLKLSAQSRNDNSTGKILNLIVVDADKVKEAMTFIIFLWASPIHVGLTMYFIWQFIGPSVLVGRYNWHIIDKLVRSSKRQLNLTTLPLLLQVNIT